MNFVAQLEDYLRDLGAEARKKHPGVKEASERAILKLRTLQNVYVSAVRKSSKNSGEKHPNTTLFRSSDILHPFLLAANYPNASPKLLDTSFKAMKTLMEANAICPGDGMNLVRVWMIQAQVVVSYSTKESSTSASSSTTSSSTGGGGNNGTSNKGGSTATLATASIGTSASGGLLSGTTTTTTHMDVASSMPTSSSPSSSLSQSALSTASSTTSWLGSFLSSSTSNNNNINSDSTTTATTTTSLSSITSSSTSPPKKKKMTNAVSTLSAVSSSHGQAGLGHLNAKDLEKLALDILSCLLQLLELRDLPVSSEQWVQSVTLCCLLYVPLRQTVRQAAHSTLPQVLTLLMKDKDATALAMNTWHDLLVCTVGLVPSNTIVGGGSSSSGHGKSKRKHPLLHGAFANCRLGEKDTAQPPSPSLSLELMSTLLEEVPTIFASKHKVKGSSGGGGGESVGQRTLGVIVQVLQQQNNHSPLQSLRLLQFVLVILQTQSKDWPVECRELTIRLIQPIPIATEALRKQPDFEDGYVYKVVVPNKGLPHVPTQIDTLRSLPPTILWRAALALETIKFMVQDQSLYNIWMHEDVLVQILESISDFCTIGASCQDHMNLLIIACRQTELGLGYSVETLTSIDSWRNGKHRNDTYILGDALWTGLVTILKMIDSLVNHSSSRRTNDTSDSPTDNDNNDHNDDDNYKAILETAFAPSLAVLQHNLKRFPASGTIVKRSLEGYFSLAKLSVQIPVLRQALLASLCRLSLPQWGTHDSTCLLRDHNIAALICLLNVMHRYYNHIDSEWSIVLQTFQELSVLAIASPHLTDNAYVGALSISAVYGRFAAFSTCLSNDSLIQFVDGLKTVSLLEQIPTIIATSNTNPVVGGANLLRIPDSRPFDNQTRDERESIGEKLMNIGVRAIYGGGNGSNGIGMGIGSNGGGGDGTQSEDVPLAERTRNSFFHDYHKDFCHRLSVGSKHPVLVDRVPFSFALLVDVAMTNSYRQQQTGTNIFTTLCSLAAESPTTTFFSMDTVAMLIMSYIAEDGELPINFTGPGKIMYSNPRQNQYLAVEQKAGVNDDGNGIKDNNIGTVQQVDLLRPLCECIRTVQSADVAEAGIAALHSIIESSGHELDVEAWTEVIQAVSSLPSSERSSGDKWSNSCQAAFRCLKLIVDDFLSHTDASTSARTSLLDCCSSFGSSRHDVNTSLTAIGLLWTIADQDAGTTAIDRALSKLVDLCSDTRTEVRNCSVNTLFSCIVGRGQAFSNTQWEACICDMVFGVYEQVTSRIGQDESDEQKPDEGPSNASKSRYRVSVHHSRDSAGKQWMGTQALVIMGLCRVLRIYFQRLLDTTDENGNATAAVIATTTTTASRKKDDTPWFEAAWNRILGFAFEASTQVGGRDTLGLRNAGIELLVLCNQLSCHAGIQAAITPARVGTNMEVINGALRSVRSPERTAGGDRQLARRTHSAVTEMWRENLFLDAFDVLDSFREYLESDAAAEGESGLSPYMEPTQVQVLSKFADDLSKLYDCCKGNEFLEDSTFSSAVSFERELQSEIPPDTEDNTLVARFVRTIVTVAEKSSSGPDSRFLSQAQRSCIDLFRAMASHGSPEALINLTFLSNRVFFNEREPNGKAKKGVDILSHEGSTVLHDEVVNPNVSNECKVLVLCRMLNVLQDQEVEHGKPPGSNVSYKLFVPMMRAGLKGAKEIDASAQASNAVTALIDTLWEKVCIILATLMSPIPNGSKLLTLQHATDLVKMVIAVSENTPARHSEEVCAILSSGASKCLDIAKVNAENAAEEKDGSGINEETRRNQDVILKLFQACFGGVCTLDPLDKRLQIIAKQILSETLQIIKKNDDVNVRRDVNLQACVLVCRVMQERQGTERLAISVFSYLCQIVGCEEIQLRRVVGGVLARVDIARTLQENQEQTELAEQRATTAEERLKILKQKYEKLIVEKESLERQLAIL